MITTIHVTASDQLLTATLMPPIASGDVNSVKFHVETDARWEGYAVSAVFFTSADATPYEVLLDSNNECIVPSEVLAEPCMLYIGIRGFKTSENAIKTSTIVKCKIREGTPTNIVIEPTLGLYEQLLQIANEAKAKADSITPVRGVNYWTDEDKAEMKAYIDDAILNGVW